MVKKCLAHDKNPVISSSYCKQLTTVGVVIIIIVLNMVCLCLTGQYSQHDNCM